MSRRSSRWSVPALKLGASDPPSRPIVATYTTPQGQASSTWTRDAQGELQTLDVTIPANTPTRVYVPASSPRQTFRALGDADVRYVGYQDGAQVYDMGAGHAGFHAADDHGHG
jgi:hypothetical protein